MDNIKDKLEELINFEKLEKIGDKIDLEKLGKKIDLDKLTDALNERKVKKATNIVIFIFALIGIAALAAGIAYLCHRYLTPAYTDEFDDDFEDFEDEDL